jgi:hypothetical protein
MKKLTALIALAVTVAVTAVAAAPARTNEAQLNIVQTAQQAGDVQDPARARDGRPGLADDLADGRDDRPRRRRYAAFKAVPKSTLPACRENRSC